MNTLYNMMLSELMVTERMKDILREAEMIRLLHEVGLSRPDLHERVAVAFGSLLIQLGQHLQRKHIHPHATSDKYAV